MHKLFLILLLLTGVSFAQQVGDPDFNPPVPSPVYSTGEGSQIYIDEAHNNFHTMDGRYKPFADLLIKDGYVVKPLRDTIVENTLEDAGILVISNALNIKNTEEWVLPVLSAFTQNEIDRIAEWVNKGGSLFLIADHMPFAGAAGELAGRFGFKLNNGFALDTVSGGSPDLFTRTAGTLKDNIITNGRNNSEKVDSIYSFTGEAFNIPEDAVSVLILNDNFISLMPDTAWNFKKILQNYQYRAGARGLSGNTEKEGSLCGEKRRCSLHS